MGNIPIDVLWMFAILLLFYSINIGMVPSRFLTLQIQFFCFYNGKLFKIGHTFQIYSKQN